MLFIIQIDKVTTTKTEVSVLKTEVNPKDDASSTEWKKRLSSNK